MVLLNAVIGFAQEHAAERTAEALQPLVPATARVIRDGEQLAGVALESEQLLFARARPEHKMRVVAALQDRGEVVAVELGRTVYQNIRKFLIYLFSHNLAELAPILVAVFVGFPLVPLSALQVLAIDLGSDVIPALALGTGRMFSSPAQSDEDNLVISLLAKKRLNVPRVIARVNDPASDELFSDSWGVDALISRPSQVTGGVRPG